MTLGDGIIEGLEPVSSGGYANNGGFRIPLLEMAAADDKSIVFVGARESGPASAVQPEASPQNHSGFAAISLPDLERMLPNPLNNYHPDIVLIHVGTFDAANASVNGDEPLLFASPMSNLRSILQDIFSANPHGLIVVSNLVKIPRSPAQSMAMSVAIEQAVNQFQRQNAAAHVEIANHFGRDISRGHDGFLPDASGYGTIAEVWYNAIEQHLK